MRSPASPPSLTSSRQRTQQHRTRACSLFPQAPACAQNKNTQNRAPETEKHPKQEHPKQDNNSAPDSAVCVFFFLGPRMCSRGNHRRASSPTVDTSTMLQAAAGASDVRCRVQVVGPAGGQQASGQCKVRQAGRHSQQRCVGGATSNARSSTQRPALDSPAHPPCPSHPPVVQVVHQARHPLAQEGEVHVHLVRPGIANCVFLKGGAVLCFVVVSAGDACRPARPSLNSSSHLRHLVLGCAALLLPWKSGAC